MICTKPSRTIFDNGIAAIAALVLVIGACVDDSFTSDPTDPSDKDEDGYSVEKGDCDDGDPEINPGAKERVNCIDDNCNDKIDEGTDNEDKDGDGYCPSTGDIKDCEGDRQRHPGIFLSSDTGLKMSSALFSPSLCVPLPIALKTRFTMKRFVYIFPKKSANA